VRLLFDQNLSRHLVDRLAADYPESLHVISVGLDAADDRAIWDYAGENDLIIVSKDSDFRQLAFVLGPPPKAIWLRVGNERTEAIRRLLAESVETVERFGASPDEALLVLPNLEV
jgi:predicted nuclease of predicted toxin-antitoxin system